MSKTNGHHIQFPKVLHTAQEASKKIRQNTWLIPPLDVDIHEALHKSIPLVPAMGYLITNRVLRDYEPYPGDYVKSLNRLIIVTHEVTQAVNVSKIEKELGLVVIESLDNKYHLFKKVLF